MGKAYFCLQDGGKGDGKFLRKPKIFDFEGGMGLNSCVIRETQNHKNQNNADVIFKQLHFSSPFFKLYVNDFIKPFFLLLLLFTVGLIHI